MTILTIHKNWILFILVVFILIGLLFGMVGLPATAGIPGIDYYKIERYYLEANTSTAANTTSTSPVTAANLTFTPSGSSANKTFLILATSLTNSTSSTETTSVHLDIDGEDYCSVNHTAADPDINWRSWGAHKVIEVPNGNPVSAAIEFYTSNSEVTAYVKWTTIAAFEIENYYYAENITLGTTPSELDVDKVTLNFTPPSAGDYSVFMAAASRSENSNKDCIVTYSDSLNPSISITTGATWGNWSHTENLTNISGSQTLKISYRTTGAATDAQIKNAYITAVRTSDLGNSQFAEANSENTTTSGVYGDKLELNFAPVSRGDWVIVGAGLGQQNDQNNSYYAKLSANGTDLGEYMYDIVDRNIYRSFMMLRKLNFSSTNQSIKLQHKTSPGGTSNSKNFTLLAIKADTVESYNDSSLQNIDDSFTTGENPYIRVHGLKASDSYAVGYYDDDGDKVATVSNLTSSTTGNLSSYYALGTDLDAAPGTWHAVVFDTTYGAPSANYSVVTSNKSASGYVTEDSFDVAASAIPEFPTIITAVVVIGTCFAIYIWMRKKRLAYVQIQN